MRIPSPRPFFEILAFILFGLCTAIGVIAAVVVLVIINSCERLYDGARAWRGRRA